MANKKISELTTGGTALPTDVFPIERDSQVNFKLTLQDVLNLIGPTEPTVPYTFPQLSATSAVVNQFTATDSSTSTIHVSNNATIDGNATVSGGITVSGTTTHNGPVTNNGSVTNTASVTSSGSTTLNGAVTITGATTVSGTISSSNTASFSGTFSTSGTTTLAGSSVLSASPVTSDNSTKIATTAFVRNVVPTLLFTTSTSYGSSDRAAGTVYTNTHSSPMCVMYATNLSNLSGRYFVMKVNGNEAQIQGHSDGEGWVCGTIIVPPGQTYQIVRQYDQTDWGDSRWVEVYTA